LNRGGHPANESNFQHKKLWLSAAPAVRPFTGPGPAGSEKKKSTKMPPTESKSLCLQIYIMTKNITLQDLFTA
jgi:hypothetical protein